MIGPADNKMTLARRIPRSPITGYMMWTRDTSVELQAVGKDGWRMRQHIRLPRNRADMQVICNKLLSLCEE